MFDLIIAQLRGIGDIHSDRYARAAFLLQSLAEVKCAILLVDIEQPGSAGYLEQLVELTNALLDSVRYNKAPVGGRGECTPSPNR